jgi:hypothetical protein
MAKPAALFVKVLMKRVMCCNLYFREDRHSEGHNYTTATKIKEQVMSRLNPHIFIDFILTKAQIDGSLISHSVSTMHDSVCYKDSGRKSLNFSRTSNKISMVLW